MKHFLLSIAAAFLVMTGSGCGNLSPRQEQKIDNPNGKIGEIDSLANSLKAEIGKLQAQADIQNSQLDRIQQGLANFQLNNDNHGVQILSGSGGLMFAIIGLLMIVVFHYRSHAQKNETAAKIMAERLVNTGDPQLIDSVFQAAMFTNAEEKVLELVKKFSG